MAHMDIGTLIALGLGVGVIVNAADYFGSRRRARRQSQPEGKQQQPEGDNPGRRK